MKEYISTEKRKNFLKDPDGVVSYTHTFKTSDVASADAKGRKILKAGTIYPKNDATAIGIVLNDVDVTDGNEIGALMRQGRVLEKALPQTINASAKSSLIAGGIHFYDDNGETLVTPA